MELTGDDREFFERELASFVPDRVFDAHVHLWPQADEEHLKAGLPRICGYDEYRKMIDWLHPGRWAGGLFLSFPYTGTARQANEWICCQAARDPACRGTLFVAQDDDPDWARSEAKRLRAVGLKCYHASAQGKYNWEADIPDYLPESIVEVAHQEGWTITLHLVKSRAVADPSNIHWVREYCRKYPNMKLILAHCGRAFQPAHALEGLPQLRGLDNLYFDSSANCEPITTVRL